MGYKRYQRYLDSKEKGIEQNVKINDRIGKRSVNYQEAIKDALTGTINAKSDNKRSKKNGKEE